MGDEKWFIMDENWENWKENFSLALQYHFEHDSVNFAKSKQFLHLKIIDYIQYILVNSDTDELWLPK